ncbi:hypothetical protein [Flavobacterium gelidilacus]|uniref:hypothetical protein n=1 Tax=Flavobacterium gelidilacus TaxID=206041 RepID=UPI00040ADB4C|nr:hypothetical protein [Flavobacterium gelidilacus]
MIKRTTAIEIKIPSPKPALKIPSITEQLVTKEEENSTRNVNVNLFFIMSYF